MDQIKSRPVPPHTPSPRMQSSSTVIGGSTPSRPSNTEQASRDIHLVSVIDATDPLIEPDATQDIQHFEELLTTAGSHLTGDVRIDRNATAPWTKRATGIPWTALLLSPVATGVGLGIFCGLTMGPPIGAAVSLVAGWMGWKTTGLLARSGLLEKGPAQLYAAHVQSKMVEPRWSGRREYELGPDRTPGIDSAPNFQGPIPPRTPDDVAGYLARNLKKYPSGTSIVHMLGHGLVYRAAAGMSFPTYEKTLEETTRQTGRPIDVLLLESCLSGSLEGLAASYPYARYTVCSEETLQVATMSKVLKSAISDIQDRTLTPRELAATIVRGADLSPKLPPDASTNSGSTSPASGDTSPDSVQAHQTLRARFGTWMKGDPSPETLTAFDNAKMPRLLSAVDELGKTLAEEAREGRTAGLWDAVRGTPQFPRPGVSENLREILKVGDLGILAQRIETVYSGEKLPSPRRWGWLAVTRPVAHPEAAASPRAAQVMQAAREVRAALNDVIVAHHTRADYQDASGLSIQLPGPGLVRNEERFASATGYAPTFDNSAAPRGWKDFVATMNGFDTLHSTATARHVDTPDLSETECGG